MNMSTKIMLLVSTALTISPITNAKSTIGGIVFANSYWSEQDNTTGSDTTKFVSELASNSRLRVRWDNEDNVGMYAELGLRSSNGTNVRHAYGKWDVNETWQILAGQTSTPFSPLNPEVAMVRNSGQSVGNTNPSRQSQVRLTRKFLNRRGAVAISFSDPNGGSTLDDAVTTGTDLGARESDFPRVDIGAAFTSFNWQVFPSVFYTRQSYTGLTTAGSDSSVISWGASLGIKKGFGPFTVSAEYASGQNWGNTRMSLSGSPAGDNAGALTAVRNGVTSIEDNDNAGSWIDLGYRFRAGEIKGAAHFIVGQLSSEVDRLGVEYDSGMIGISVPMDLPWIARGFRIRPELFVFDDGDNTVLTATGIQKVDHGKRTILGVQLQYTF